MHAYGDTIQWIKEVRMYKVYTSLPLTAQFTVHCLLHDSMLQASPTMLLPSV